MKTLAACVVLLAAVPVAWAATPLDGTYSGNYAVNGGARSERCSGGAMKINVKDGSFAWGGNDPTSVQVAPDGTFTGQAGRRYLKGKIADGKVSATVTTENCNYTWSLSR